MTRRYRIKQLSATQFLVERSAHWLEIVFGIYLVWAEVCVKDSQAEAEAEIERLKNADIEARNYPKIIRRYRLVEY